MYLIGEVTVALEKEMATYDKHLPEMAAHAGKFVLIHGEEIVDFFSSYEDAIKAGYQKFKLEPFFVRQVQVSAQVQFISRMFDPSLNAVPA